MKGQLYSFYILHQYKYRENSLLLSIFTREFGKLSALIRINKKNANLYQPLTRLRGEINFAKKDTGLNKLYNVEFVESHCQSSYINLLSLQYINELLYLLLNYSHEEAVLFSKYSFILKNINDINYRYLLRMFELELLDSLGQGVYIESDMEHQLIDESSSYNIIGGGFKKTPIKSANTVIGSSLLKINQPITSWNSTDLKVISRVTRINIDNILSGRKLKSRELLLDYLSLKGGVSL